VDEELYNEKDPVIDPNDIVSEEFDLPPGQVDPEASEDQRQIMRGWIKTLQGHDLFLPNGLEFDEVRQIHALFVEEIPNYPRKWPGEMRLRKR
jgi:hypothetical protein